MHAFRFVRCRGRTVGAVAALLFAAFWLASAGHAVAAGITETFSKATAGSKMTIDHGAWDRLLKDHVVAGPDGINRVDYARFKKNGLDQLKAYVRSLEAVDVAALDRAEQAAFWINLYNARTADLVLERYPVKSIQVINLPDAKGVVADGPWKAKVVKVANVDLSLDEIENEILRPIYKDPRVHYALNCLSIGCPNLLAEAFTGSRLDALYDAGARAFVNHPRGISIDGAKARASSIYEWFVGDFGGDLAAVLSHMRTYAEPGLRAKLDAVREITEYHYDWTLNDAGG
jgi:hypothetical protein